MKEKIWSKIGDSLSLKYLLRCVMHTAESEFLKFMIEYEYMGEIEIIFENTLALLSGAQMGLHHENRKSRDTLPH